jgi:hypothetical protein
MPRYFFERDDVRLDLRVRDVLLDLRAPVDLRPVLPAVVRDRVLPPAVPRVLRAGFARRDELFAVLFFDEPFVSPASRRCLFTVRAASSSARSRLAPRLRADCLIFSY